MSKENKLSKLPDSVEGKDYIVDYYSILGLKPDADEQEIRAAFLTGIRQYHPDIVSRAAPDIQTHAAYRTQNLIKARDILLDPLKKQAFDETLSNWGDKPISTEGNRLIIISSRAILQDEEELSDAIDRAKSLSGFDQTMFSFIEDQFTATQNPSDNLTNAYREGLRRKDLYLGAQEHLLSESAGIATPSNTPALAYKSEAEDRVSRRKSEIDSEIEEAFVMLEQGLIPMLGAGNEVVTELLKNDKAQALDIYRDEVIKKFDQKAEQILSLATEREDIIAKRLSVLRANYIGQQDNLFERVIVGMQFNDETIWLPFIQNGSEINIDSETLAHDLSNLDQTDKANEKYLQGYNVILAECEENLPVLESASEVAFRHYEKLIMQQGLRMERGDITTGE